MEQEHRDEARQEKDEAALVASLRANEPQAYATLIERYADRLYATAYAIVQNPADAEEVVQETLITVYRRIGDFRGEAKLSTWLYRIATNKALELLRRHRRERGHASLEVLDEQYGELPFGGDEMDGEAWVEQAERLACIRGGLQAMSPALRTVWVLAELEGLTMREIAEAEGLSLSTVKVRLHRARRFLLDYVARRRAAALGEEGGEG